MIEIKEVLNSTSVIEARHKLDIENKYVNRVKQYSTKTIIQSVYLLSISIMNNKKRMELWKKDMRFFPWYHPDILYYSIILGNDYKKKEIKNLNELLNLIEETENVVDKRAIGLISNCKSDGVLVFFGIVGEQYRYQREIKTILLSLINELYILLSISKISNSNINVEEIVKEEVGVSWEEVIIILYGIFVASSQGLAINSVGDYIYLGGDKAQKIDMVINYYTANYKDIKESPLGRQIFYTKPYIKTQNGEVVTASVYFNLFIVEHAIYWIIRDHFRMRNQDFACIFGKWYENMLMDICEFYKQKIDRIDESSKEIRADWELELGQYTFLIEQKSALIALDVKQQVPNAEEYNKAVNKTIFKSAKQLCVTEKALNLKGAIKIMLCYDDFYENDMLPQLLARADSPVVNDGRYFIANTLEIEMLIELANKDNARFEMVVEHLVKNNYPNHKESIRILKVMQESGFSINSYLYDERFKKYKQFLKKIDVSKLK